MISLLAAVALLIGPAVGFAAAWIEQHYAPVGLFPLVVGLATGACVGWLARRLGKRGFLKHVAAATLCAGTCVGTMHYASYLVARRAADEAFATQQRFLQAMPQQGFVAPPATVGSFRDFVTERWHVGRLLGKMPVRGVWLAVWWTIDALLVWLGAMVAAVALGDIPRRTARPTETTSSTSNTGEAP